MKKVIPSFILLFFLFLFLPTQTVFPQTAIDSDEIENQEDVEPEETEEKEEVEEVDEEPDVDEEPEGETEQALRFVDGQHAQSNAAVEDDDPGRQNVVTQPVVFQPHEQDQRENQGQQEQELCGQ